MAEKDRPYEVGETIDPTNIEIVRYNLRDLEGIHNPLRDGLIETYQTIFRGNPWNEYRECGDCSQSYPQEIHDQIYKNQEICYCIICQKGTLTDPHSYENVWEGLQTELGKRNSLLLIAGQELPEPLTETERNVTNNPSGQKPKVAGFSWGFSGEFSSTMNYVFDQYFPHVDTPDRKSISGNIREQLGNPLVLSYMSELGVRDDLRGTHVAYDLIHGTAQKVLDGGFSPYVFWTSRGKIQTPVQEQYGLSSDDNVLMAGKFADIKQAFETNDYQPGDRNSWRKVARHIIGNVPDRSVLRQDGSKIYPMILGLGGKPFDIPKKQNK